jgi:hypothetical protein
MEVTIDGADCSVGPGFLQTLSRLRNTVLFKFVLRRRFRRQPLKGADIPTESSGTNIMQVLSFSGRLGEATHLRGPPRREVFSGDFLVVVVIAERWPSG